MSRGLAYLSASRIEDGGSGGFDMVFFCNLFYLHRTEERLIRNAYECGKAVVIFKEEGSWPVLDALAKRTGWNIEPSATGKPSYQLSIQEGFDLHSQVCMVRDILKGLGPTDNSVVVLPDASGLIPLMSEISGVCGDFNVSLGYPLKRSSVYSLFEAIARAQQTKKMEGITHLITCAP